MWVRWILLFFIANVIFTTKGATQVPKEELICFNSACFVPEPSETVVLKDSIALERDVNPEVDEYLEPVFNNKLPYLEQRVEDQHSKFYSILNPDVPFFKKRFMNVRAWDMTFGTHPEFESTRPNIILEYINKPVYKGVNFYWEDD